MSDIVVVSTKASYGFAQEVMKTESAFPDFNMERQMGNTSVVFSSGELRIVPNKDVDGKLGFRRKKVVIFGTGYDQTRGTSGIKNLIKSANQALEKGDTDLLRAILHIMNRDIEQMTLCEGVVDLLLLVHHAKTSGASEIIVVIPHFPFARQDRKDQTRSNISAAWFARMLESSGATTVMTMDLHNPATQGVFSGLNLPCHNLFFSIVWKKFFAGHFNKETHAVIAPDAGAFKQAQNFAMTFDLNVATIFKRRDVTAENAVSTFGLSGAKFVRDKTGIILDDMLDTGGTICAAAAELEKKGVTELVIIVTHGILSGPAIDRLNGCNQIKKVYVTDTVPQDDNVRKMHGKLEVISVAPLFAEVLKRYFSGASISELFN